MGIVGRFRVVHVVRKSGEMYASGVRSGLRGLLSGPRYRAAPPVIKRQVGSPATDRDARRRDTRTFGGDVERRERIVLTK
jgi:hypothetical protein